LLVYTQLQQNRLQDAHATCLTGLELFPLDAELRFREGVLLHELGRYEESVRAYLDVMRSNEERHFSSLDSGIKGFKARQNLAVVYTDMGELAKAERQWRQVVHDEPKYRPGWRGLGDVLLKRGKAKEALAMSEQLLKDIVLKAEGTLLRSRVCLHEGNASEARRVLKEGLRESDGDLETLRLLCQVLFEHGSPQEAEQALRLLVTRDANDASAHHNLGTLLLQAKKYGESARSYRKSILLRPDSALTYLHLGYALKANGRIDEAIGAWKHVLRLSPGDPAALDELRRANDASGK
jgi:tetratricopeptide (TPR) repeat protein